MKVTESNKDTANNAARTIAQPLNETASYQRR